MNEEKLVRKLLINLAFLSFMFLRIENAFTDTFERLEIIGSANQGATILVCRSHFGPSSYAPFVKIEIWEVNSSESLFIDGMSKIQGTETDVTEMKQQLIDKNIEVIKKYKINFTKTGIPTNTIQHDFEDQILIEADLFNNGDVSRYHLQFFRDPKTLVKICSLNQSPIDCINFESFDPFIASFDKIFFSRLLNVEKTVWLFFFAKVEPLLDLFFYPQFIAGFSMDSH